MNWINRRPDSFLLGVLSAGFFLPLALLGMKALSERLTLFTGVERWSLAPQPQLFTLLLALIVFRLLVINWKREQTGRGWLLVTFLVSIGYAWWFYRLRHAH